METQIKSYDIQFDDIKNNNLIRKEINAFFDHYTLGLNQSEVDQRKWSYAQMEAGVNQIFDEDADNLSRALKSIEVPYFYGTYAEYFFDNKNNFEVAKFCPIEKETIEFSQGLHWISHLDSFIFGDYPLKFLIMKPAFTEKNFLYILGDNDFIREVTKFKQGWTVKYFGQESVEL
ncbi:hypothetical protein [Pasteurella atlantica]|uniref:hypothetical protein n=1 Tax=Pasteurellaceae TaxID=712 RepID=UPI0027757E2A|nr:hypothetical protein [Pasteurella atlantica]MDP8100100.1 hypothetical protein [Pasteurella atlantica]MDP8106227.1 hypothetical protein [Pasteurella atlantica]MDP8115956.1 hypothetical protein [Pasteurella atlantica]